MLPELEAVAFWVAERGDPIRIGEKEIGQVTSSVFSPACKRPVAFGYVHRDYLRPGTPVSISHSGITIPAEVSSLPFYNPTLSPDSPS